MYIHVYRIYIHAGMTGLNQSFNLGSSFNADFGNMVETLPLDFPLQNSDSVGIDSPRPDFISGFDPGVG